MFCNFLCCSTVLLACLLLAASVDGLKRYTCNSSEKIDDIRNLNTSLRRLVQHENRLYFVFKDRIISTDLPASEDKTRYKFLSLDFQEQENKEPDTPSSIGNEYQVFGYLYDVDKKQTSELYFKDANRNRSTALVQNTLHDKRYLLGFENGELKRTTQETVDARLSVRLAATPNVIFFNGILKKFPNATYDLLLKYSWVADENQDIDHSLHFEVDYYKKTNTLKYQPAFRQFAFHLFKMEYDDEGDGPFDGLNGTKHGKFIGVQEQVARLQFFVFFLPRRVASKIFEFEIAAEDLFNCYSPVENLDKDLKGIYYDAEKKLWFIFIRRFYLKFDRDVLDDEFALEPNDYLSGGRELELYRSTKFFELSDMRTNYKLIRNIGNKALLTLETYTYLEISLDQKDELVFTPMPKNSKLDVSECSYSTLLIANHMYCWTESHYSHLFDMSTPDRQQYRSHAIGALFDQPHMNWGNQQVKLVFNYDKEHFVIMTATDLFVFEYSRFKVGPNSQLMHSYNNSEEFTKMRNCLPENNCIGARPTRSPDPFLRNLASRIAMILLVVGIVIIFALLIWTFRRGVRGEGSERAQYFIHLVNRMGSKMSKSFSKLSIGSRLMPASQMGSMSDIPSGYLKPKKDEVLAKAVKGLKGLKNVKDLKVVKSAKPAKGGRKSPKKTSSQSSLPGDKGGKDLKKKKSLTGDKGGKDLKKKKSLTGDKDSKIKGSQLGEKTKSKGSQLGEKAKSKGSQLGDKETKSKGSQLGDKETKSKGSQLGGKTKSRDSRLGDKETKSKGSQLGEKTKSRGSQISDKELKSTSKSSSKTDLKSSSKPGSKTELKSKSSQPGSKADLKSKESLAGDKQSKDKKAK